MNWSFSSLMIYEACPYRFKLAKIDRIPEPPRPPDNPLERGNRIHKAFEDYVMGKTGAVVSEARQQAAFEPALEHLRVLYTNGIATAEQDWLYNQDWEGCERDAVWLWSKLDASVQDELNNLAIAIDYKSGKSQYKQIEHVQQLQLYAAITALRFKWADRIVTELWYVDEGHVRQSEYTRDQALGFVGRFDKRAQRIFNDTLYRANPNRETCRYCPYSPRGNGVCPVGV